MGKVIAAVVAIIIIAGGGYLALHKSSNKSSGSNTNSGQSSQASPDNSTSNTSSSNKPVAATIIYSDNGFSPQTVTVKAGDTIAIKNTSSQDMQFDSDPHPAHTDDEELNVGVVAPNQSATFTVDKVGSHGYHNHLNPSDTGTIVVQ